MVDRLLVQCVIPRNAEVWTSVLVSMPSAVASDRSQRELQRQLKVNIMFNRKKDKLIKDVPFSSDLADFVL